VRIGRYSVETSNTDKVFYPGEGITKGDVIDYYRGIGKTMVPHMKGRPVSMRRFPDGLEGYGFFQKEVPGYFPDWIDRVEVKKKQGGSEGMVVCNNTATLVYLANQACLVPHIWLSRSDRPDNPDKMVFDLDPTDEDFGVVKRAAAMYRDLLEEVGLASFVMTTGSRGLHVVVPLDRSANFDRVRTFARDLSGVLAGRNPGEFTVEPRKNKRKGRLYLDDARNSYAQTSVPPYSLRAKPGAPVATPLDWSELDDSDLVSQRYDIGNIQRRLARKGDPWKGMFRHARSLSGPAKKLEKIVEEQGEDD